MATVNLALIFPTAAQLQAMAGPGVTVEPVTFPDVDPITIVTDDETEDAVSRICDGMCNFGWYQE